MSSLTTGVPSRHTRGALEKWRGIALAIGLAAVIGGCASSAATPTAAAQGSVVGATATPTPTPTSAATPTAASTPTTAPTSTPKPTPVKTAAPKATPLPALAIGLCTAAQLKLTIGYWIGSSGNPTYPHIMATNVSSGSCNMRGKPRTQLVDGSGKVIVDAGNGGAEISTADPVYTLVPNGVIYDILEWDNWCKSAPKQKVTVAVVMPFGLGRFVAKSNGDAPIPYCSSSGSGTMLSADAWTP